MKVKILSPVEGYNGISAGVKFIRGVAEVDEKDLPLHVIDWLIAKKYQVILPEKAKPKKGKAEEVVEIVEVVPE